MRLVVHLDQLFHRNVGVDLGSGESRVAQQFLDVSQVCAAVEQVRGERMAQCVWTDVMYARAEANVLFHQTSDRARRYARALVIQDERLGVAFGSRRMLQETFTHVEVVLQGPRGRIAERHNTFFAALTEHAQQFALEIDVAEIELDQFRNAHAGRIEQFEDGPVALSEIGFNVRGLNEADGVFDGKMDGQLLFLARSRDQLCRIQFDDAFAHQKLEECAQRGELSGYRRLLLFVSVKNRQPLANRQVIDLSDVRFFSLSIVCICGRQIIEELEDVTFVIAQGVRAHVALVAQMVKELSEKVIDHGVRLSRFRFIQRLLEVRSIRI